MLHVPGEPGGAGCSERKTDLEDLHNSGCRETDGSECGGDKSLRTIRSVAVVVAHHRSGEEGDLRGNRGELHNARYGGERRHPGLRYGNRAHALVTADYGERCLQFRMPDAGVDQLPERAG